MAFEIIDEQSWKIKDSDKLWQNKIVQFLQKNKNIQK